VFVLTLLQREKKGKKGFVYDDKGKCNALGNQGMGRKFEERKKRNASTINIEHLQDRRNFISKTNSPKTNVGSQDDKEKKVISFDYFY